MEVIGFFIKEISSKREENIQLPLSINNKTAIKEIEEIEVKTIEKKCLKVCFEFKTEYIHQKKKMGEIKISGHMLFIHEDYKKILNSWKKKKVLPEEVNVFLINHVLRKCITKSVLMAEDLALPSPIPLPIARIQKKTETKYIA